MFQGSMRGHSAPLTDEVTCMFSVILLRPEWSQGPLSLLFQGVPKGLQTKHESSLGLKQMGKPGACRVMWLVIQGCFKGTPLPTAAWPAHFSSPTPFTDFQLVPKAWPINIEVWEPMRNGQQVQW